MIYLCRLDAAFEFEAEEIELEAEEDDDAQVHD
jgi:hypothetical protein